MSRKTTWRYGEERVITITPAARGLVLPVFATILAVILVQLAVGHLHFLRSLHMALLVVFVVPCLLVVATRTWRWRSHKVHVTSQRIIAEGGVLRHQRSEVDLRDVFATHLDQRVSERLTRRGVVSLDTRAGNMSLGVVHHPKALLRIIDLERAQLQDDDIAFDTVFDFDSPVDQDFEINPRRRRDHR